MTFKQAGTWVAMTFFAISLTGCTSEAARERQQQREAAHQVAEDEETMQGKQNTEFADRAIMLQAQEKLDAVEQKRTKNVYAHSCRKVTMASYALNASNVDTSQCSAEQLKLEQDAERSQVFDKAFEDAAQDRNKN
jgi:HD-GYP domain-containing protein (c-di-GMP phosphodiesterase class II)